MKVNGNNVINMADKKTKKEKIMLKFMSVYEEEGDSDVGLQSVHDEQEITITVEFSSELKNSDFPRLIEERLTADAKKSIAYSLESKVYTWKEWEKELEHQKEIEKAECEYYGNLEDID